MKRDHRDVVAPKKSVGGRTTQGISRATGGSTGAGRNDRNNRRVSEAEHPPELCRYPNKRCSNVRALKENGECHSLCEWHRDCANHYQRRLEERRKTQNRGDVGAPAAASPSSIAAALAIGTGRCVRMPTTSVPSIQSVSASLASKELETESKKSSTLSSPATTPPPQASDAHEAALMSVSALNQQELVLESSLAPSEAELLIEPFQSPVTLQREDLQLLALFLPTDASPSAEPS